MNYIVYIVVTLIAASSVLFGLDFSTAPMPPMPASPYALRAAAPPQAPAVATADSNSAPKTEAAASAVAVKLLEAPAAPAPAAPAPVAAIAPPPASIAADEPGSVAAASAAPAPRCDLDACAAAYRSFTPEDCTYQPFDGPRLLCTKGKPPVAGSPAIAAPAAAPEARAQACNIAACSQSYPRSFSSADCTFQPAEGPRRVCTK